jgi:hypothetical protein
MRLPLLVSTVLVVSVVSSLCTALVCLHLSPQTATTPSAATAPAPSAPPLAVMAPAPQPVPLPAMSHLEVARRQPAPAEVPALIPPPPPPLDEVIPPPPVTPPYYGSSQPRTPAAAPAPATVAEAAPAPEDPAPIYVQHEVNDTIYRDYYGCNQAEVVVINTCQRCYQFHHADVLAVCLVARWAGVPLSVAFRTFYDDDHGSIQALVAGYHLDAGIFFVALPADLACPGLYQRPYLKFRTLRGGEEAFSNDEYRALIALKIACEFQGRQPAQFFAALQHGDTPLQAIYRNPTATHTAILRSWSGGALHPLPAGAAAAASEHRQPVAGAPASVSTRNPGEVEATTAPHAGPQHGAATHLDQPVRAEQPVHGNLPIHSDAQEHAPPPVVDAGHGSARPTSPPIERRTSEPAPEHPAQGPASHDAAGPPLPAPAGHLRAEPSAPAAASSGQAAAASGGLAAPVPAGQAAATGTAPLPHH